MVTGVSQRPAGTLPAEAAGFVGRRAELAQVSALLERARLVTVTGTGGVGKTRLAVRAAAAAAGRYPDGVYLIELAALRDPGLLADTVAARLAVPCEDKRSPLEAILDYLRGHRVLLILDACEHLIGACAKLADATAREAAGVTLLATSRHPLDVAGESIVPLYPLPVPETGDRRSDSDAVRLFAQRAAGVVPGFTVTDENRADVIRLCRRLDGIPLAIELATVQLRALPLEQMAARFDDRFRLLTDGKGTGVPRHPMLQTAIEWSYELCTPAERLLWARLSVFAGSFDAGAAKEVCAGAELSGDEITGTLASLVDKAVLVRDAMAGGTTYRMLDTLREFGAEHLAGTSSEAGVLNRYVAHYLAMAERFAARPARDQLRQYRKLRREHPNLRAAFGYALGLPGNSSAAIALATSLYLYWPLSGLLHEGEYWLDRALERCPQPSPVRARVLSMRAQVAVLLGDFVKGQADAEDSIELAMKHKLGDLIGVAFGLGSLAFMAVAQQRYERTAWLLGASAPLWERSGRRYTGDLVFEELHRAAERAAQDGIGEDRCWLLYRRGATGPLHHVVGRAVADADDLPAEPQPPRAAPLTDREFQVAELVTGGMSHRQAAARLGIAKRTAGAHVEHIFGKLGISSRVQLTVWLRDRAP